MVVVVAVAAAVEAAGGWDSGLERWHHLVPGAGGEAREGVPGGTGYYGNGLKSEELEPREWGRGLLIHSGDSPWTRLNHTSCSPCFPVPLCPLAGCSRVGGHGW
uniref:Uncharacterized protein n=1 Tax=Monodon monoceros TaxID=40151 RepID=A0A8C6FC98_MONMO